MGYEDERRVGRTFLNAYKSVRLLDNHKAIFIHRDDAVEPVAVLPRGVRLQSPEPPEVRRDKEHTVVK